jgi:hypothetical protein
MTDLPVTASVLEDSDILDHWQGSESPAITRVTVTPADSESTVTGHRH